MRISVAGQSLEADVLDAGFAERLQEALGQMANDVRAARAEGMPKAERIRRQCRAIFACFNHLFGEGSDRKLFGGQCEWPQALGALEELARELRRQQQEAAQALAAYLPDDR